MSRAARCGHRPGSRHLALLHAGLDEDDSAALEAWLRWRGQVEFDDVDRTEQRLLPLAYLNLGEAIRDDPAFGRAAGLYRRTWSQNQLLFDSAAERLTTLVDAGIEVLLLNGAPLTVLHYHSAGARPMANVDVLIRPEEADRAAAVLRAAGWRAPVEPAGDQFRVQPGVPFRDGGPGEVALRWFSLWESSDDGPLWEAARPFDLAGARALAPCPADLLLAACVPGSPRHPATPSCWIADAVTVCRTGEIDWDRLVHEARRRNLRVAAAAALEHLGEEFGVATPPGVHAGLAPRRAPGWERAEFRAQRASPSPLRTLRLLRARHRRITMLGTPTPRNPGFLAYAASTWGLERSWQLPAYAFRRTARHLASRFSPRPARG